MLEPVDWSSVAQETVRTLSRLIKAETTNPPGNELPAILAIKDILERDGFPPEDITIVESAPNRANLVARQRGDGSKRPLLLSGHVDVVPVEPARWSRDPFGGEVVDGDIWGRGALDMKGMLAMYLHAFLLARRRRLPLKRDLILAAVADEEAGFEHGSKLLVEKHRSLIDAEYALTELGAMTMHVGKHRLYPIQVAEKGLCWLRARAAGRPGHGSLPHDDNAVFHLAGALYRLQRARRLPIHITPTFRSMVAAVSGKMGIPLGPLVGLLGTEVGVGLLLPLLPPRVRTIVQAFTSNTFTPTGLKAGSQTNVIPSLAEAEIDCRKLPGQTPADVISEIRQVIGQGLELEVIRATDGAEFPTDTPLYRLLERAAQSLDDGGLVLPTIAPGATDACQYQRAGIIVYGFTPGLLPADYPLINMAHGHDERLPVTFIESGLPALWDVVRTFCAT